MRFKLSHHIIAWSGADGTCSLELCLTTDPWLSHSTVEGKANVAADASLEKKWNRRTEVNTRSPSMTLQFTSFQIHSTTSPFSGKSGFKKRHFHRSSQYLVNLCHWICHLSVDVLVSSKYNSFLPQVNWLLWILRMCESVCVAACASLCCDDLAKKSTSTKQIIIFKLIQICFRFRFDNKDGLQLKEMGHIEKLMFSVFH